MLLPEHVSIDACIPLKHETHGEITLVSNQHDCHIWVGMLSGIFQPTGKMVEGLSPAASSI